MMNQEETVKVQEPSATISSNGSESGSLEANISNNSVICFRLDLFVNNNNSFQILSF